MYIHIQSAMSKVLKKRRNNIELSCSTTIQTGTGVRYDQESPDGLNSKTANGVIIPAWIHLISPANISLHLPILALSISTTDAMLRQAVFDLHHTPITTPHVAPVSHCGQKKKKKKERDHLQILGSTFLVLLSVFVHLLQARGCLFIFHFAPEFSVVAPLR